MKGINAYQTFGLSSQWLDEYFVDPQKWWKANSLGPRQFEAMQVWLDHAGITDRARKDLTPLGAKLREFGSRNPLTWYAIWVNLAEKSVIVNWYVRNAEWHRPYTKRDLVESIGDDLSERTRDNAIASLVRLIDESPLGHEIGIGRVDRAGRVVTAITRLKPRELPNTALLYCLYRYAERADRYGLSVHELLEDREGALAQLFGINEDALTRSLRSIASLHSEILHIDVVRDLDSVYLEPSTSSVEALFLER